MQPCKCSASTRQLLSIIQCATYEASRIIGCAVVRRRIIGGQSSAQQWSLYRGWIHAWLSLFPRGERRGRGSIEGERDRQLRQASSATNFQRRKFDANRGDVWVCWYVRSWDVEILIEERLWCGNSYLTKLAKMTIGLMVSLNIANLVQSNWMRYQKIWMIHSN